NLFCALMKSVKSIGREDESWVGPCWRNSIASDTSQREIIMRNDRFSLPLASTDNIHISGAVERNNGRSSRRVGRRAKRLGCPSNRPDRIHKWHGHFAAAPAATKGVISPICNRNPSKP